MKLIQLNLLVAIDKYGSLSRAAAEFYISQSTVSLYMKSLEDEIGYRLLNRTNRGAELTEMGKLVLVQAEKITQAMDEIRHIAAIQDGKMYGTVSISALPHICNTVLAELQSAMQLKYPNLVLDVASKPTKEIIRDLERREVSFGVFQTCDVEDGFFPGRVNSRGWSYGKLTDDEMLFCVGEKNPLASRGELTLDELLSYPYISYNNPDNLRLSSEYEKRGMTLKPIIMRDFIPMRRFANQNDCFTLLPRRAVEHGNLNYSSKFVPLNIRDVHWITGVVWVHPGAGCSEAENVVLDRMRKMFSQPEAEK